MDDYLMKYFLDNVIITEKKENKQIKEVTNEYNDIIEEKTSKQTFEQLINSFKDQDLDELINIQIESILKSNIFGNNFNFRIQQREAIIEIVKTLLENKIKNIIISAPTGSGKSIMAMFSSKILQNLGFSGYIIASDLSLQDQYENDFKLYDTLNYFSVKGVDNYLCHINNLKFSLGECHIKNISYEEVSKLGCYKTCAYHQARKKAMNSRVSLLNYSYWLLQRNYVAKKLESEPFKKRNFVFFDEAHKIDEIIQNHFSPRFEKNLSFQLEKLNDLLFKYNFILDRYYQRTDIEIIINKLIKEQDNDKLFKYLLELELVLKYYVNKINDIKIYATRNLKNKSIIPANWRKIFYYLDKIKDIHCKLEDYNEIIKNEGIENIIKREDTLELNFNTLNEEKLIRKYLHNESNFKIFMSATIGSIDKYIKIMGIDKDNYVYINMDNMFDYKKSPIFYLPYFKLSFKNKDNNINEVIKIMDLIINKHHVDQKGIIHSGSYEFTKKILENSKIADRLLSYTNTTEKKEVLKIFEKSKNKILIGPSLLEGLDLKDDKSRFQIFFKVPYPSLADPLIKAKLQTNPIWYSWKTLCNILQGMGRSIRSIDDWAITYLLDGCFENVIQNVKKDNDNKIFISRLIKL